MPKVLELQVHHLSFQWIFRTDFLYNWLVWSPYSPRDKLRKCLLIWVELIMASSPITSWQIDGETMETVTDFIFLGSKIPADSDCSQEIKRCLLLGRKAMTNLDSILKSRDITDKGPSSQGYGFSSSHLWMWELNHKESWAPKYWCFWAVVLQKSWESLGLQGDQTSQL